MLNSLNVSIIELKYNGYCNNKVNKLKNTVAYKTEVNYVTIGVGLN